MKILAIGKDKDQVNWDDQAKTLYKEAAHVYDLYQRDIIREIYFSDTKNAVLILECKDKQEAIRILNEFPLVINKLIEFEVMELHAYTGFSRLFTSK